MNRSTLQRRGFTFWEFVIVLGTLALLAAILFPFFARPRESDGNRNPCPSNLKQIMLGFKQYIQDYDGKYPILATSPTEFGWAGTMQPYLKSTQIFQCPDERTALNSDPASPGYTDYWFNARMAGLAEIYLEHQALTIALGDGESSDARNHISEISPSWRSDANSPLYRHREGAHFAFADGHAKWFRGDQWKNGLDLFPRVGSTLRIKPRN